jgi:ABC-type uncharacterized transport system ATPase subunit
MRVTDLPRDQRTDPEKHFAVYLRDVRVALNGFNLSVDSYGLLPGRLEVLIGPNGAGKTTLCDLISGKTRIDHGQIYLDGVPVSTRSEDRIARMGVGRKFQTPNVFNSLTVFQNMELALPGRETVFKNLGRHNTKREEVQILHDLGRLDLAGIESQLAGALSHGQRQRLELAMLIASGAKVLIVDEPAAGLDQKERDQIVVLLRDLSVDHSILAIEHDLDFIKNLQADVTVMSGGSDVAFGTFASVWSMPIVREIYQGSVVERPMTQAVRAAEETNNFTVDDISVYHGSARTLDHVSLCAKSGSVACVLGRNGAGKTTLMRTIMGIQAAATGSISVIGKRLDGMKPFERSRKGLSLTPQGRGIIPRLTVEENLLLGCEARPAARAKIPRAVFEAFPWMDRDRKKDAGLLSGGQQQQLAIARALVSQPLVLLLDEPTDGIDLPTVKSLVVLVRSLVAGKCPLLPAGQRVSICMVEQNLGFVQSVADWFYILERGRIVREGRLTELTPSVVDRFLGEESP